ncbi:MAG: tyrosine-type recombinase/integrase [Caldilineaceae bacterium]
MGNTVELFLNSKAAAGRSTRTLDWYAEQLDHAIACLGADLLLVDAEHIELFFVTERLRNLAPATIHARYRALKVFYNWCVSRGYLSASPIDKVEKPALPHKRPNRATLAEYELLLDSIPTNATWLDSRDRCILRILFFSGLRLSECARLRVSDLDVNGRRIMIRAGKGAKDRTVPFAADCAADLLEYLYTRPTWRGPELWLKSDGYHGLAGALAPEGIRQILRRRCIRAGCRILNPHSFRHGFAMTLLNVGHAEMSAISRMLGHSKTQVTEAVYAQWNDDGLSDEYEAALLRIWGKKK